jgi:hypothetical protein
VTVQVAEGVHEEAVEQKGEMGVVVAVTLREWAAEKGGEVVVGKCRVVEGSMGS